MVKPTRFWPRKNVKKVKEVDLYSASAFIVVHHTQGAQVRITQCYLQYTPYLPLPRKHSPDGASPYWGCGHLIAAYYSCIYPERLSRPGWLTYSGRFTHISGHLSAAGRAQDSESSPVRDRRSTTVPRNQPPTNTWNVLILVTSSSLLIPVITFEDTVWSCTSLMSD